MNIGRKEGFIPSLLHFKVFFTLLDEGMLLEVVISYCFLDSTRPMIILDLDD